MPDEVLKELCRATKELARLQSSRLSLKRRWSRWIDGPLSGRKQSPAPSNPSALSNLHILNCHPLGKAHGIARDLGTICRFVVEA